VAAGALVAVLALLVWTGVAVAGLFRGEPEPEPAAQPAAGVSVSPSATPTPQDSASPSADPAASGEPEPSDSGSAEGEGTSDAPTAEACRPGDIAVTASTDQQAYGVSAEPVLTMTIVNEGETPCTVDAGTGQQDFTVASGSDRIFSTSDCLADPSSLDIELAPGQEETARFTWERERSAPGCKDVPAKPRPGTYNFTAKLGDVTSNKVSFTLQ
jgi:hypothetical protein